MPVVLAFVWSATLGEGVLQGDVSLQFSLSSLSSKGVGKGGKGIVNLPMGWYYGLYGMGCSQEKYPLNAFFQIIQKYKIQHTHTHTSRVFSVLLLANPVTQCGFPAIYYWNANLQTRLQKTELHQDCRIFNFFYMANQLQRLVNGWMGWQIRYICFLLCLAPNHTFDSNDFLPSSLGFSTDAMWLPFWDKKDVVFFQNKKILSNVSLLDIIRRYLPMYL